MQQVVATLINALIISSMYILVTLGFAFLFYMLGILNLAHGAIYMVGGYIGYMLIVGMDINRWLALLLSILIVAAFGVFLEKFCFRPFVGNLNRTIMVCVAIMIILQNTVNIMLGTRQLAIPPFADGFLRAGPISVSYERIVTFSIGAILLVVITWFVNRTGWGQKMQAISQNMEGARLQGINVHRVSALACALGCGLAALAGCLMGAYLRLGPFMGDFMLLKVLIVVMLAGVGSFGGIFIAGLVLGSLNAVLPVLLSGAVSDAILVTIVVVLLLVRPKGFFGHEVEMASDNQPSESKLSTLARGRRKWVEISVYGGLVVILALLPLLLNSPYMEHILTLSFIYIVASVSLRTITISGQFPLAHAAFMGIGAYLSGMASKWLGWSPWLTIPLGGIGVDGPRDFNRIPLCQAEGALLCHG